MVEDVTAGPGSPEPADLPDAAVTADVLDATTRYAASILAALPDRPVVPVGEVTPASDPLPVSGTGFAGALDLFARRWAPGFSASAGPRYLGFVTGGSTPAGIAGDWLAAVFDQNPAASDGSSASALERETVRWLASMFGLGDVHTGAFVTGATMSNFVGLALGREWLGERAGVSVAESGVTALGPVKVYSGAPHSSTYKALSMLGLGRDSLRLIPSLPDREAIDVAQLAAELDGTPAIVVANAGTVNTADFDDLRALVELRSRTPFWLHVDAAFGGFAALSPAFTHLVDGLADADSICVDLHKWLNVPYDAAVQFTRRRDLQVEVFRNSAAYLGLPTEDPDFVHLTPENSRRLRALATWFTLTAYGQDGHRRIVERTVDLAHRLGDLLADTPGVRVLAPVRLNVVCFTLADTPTPDRIAEVARRIASGGATFLTPTVYKGQPALRAAFSNWRTEPSDLTTIHTAIADACTDL